MIFNSVLNTIVCQVPSWDPSSLSNPRRWFGLDKLKLVVAQFVKKFHTIYWNWSFITLFTKAAKTIMIWIRTSTFLLLIFLNTIFNFTPCPCRCSKWPTSVRFSTKIWYEYIIFHVGATYNLHFMFLDFITHKCQFLEHPS